MYSNLLENYNIKKLKKILSLLSLIIGDFNFLLKLTNLSENWLT